MAMQHHAGETEDPLQIVLDHMPGALVYTDSALRIVICNDRFREMYRVPDELLQPGRPYADLLRHLARNDYYGPGDVEAHVHVAWRACTIHRARASRTTRRTDAGTASCAEGSRAAGRSP